jgi:hypothetical protein
VLSGFTSAGDLFPTRHIPKLRDAARAQFADVIEEMEGDLAE